MCKVPLNRKLIVITLIGPLVDVLLSIFYTQPFMFNFFSGKGNVRNRPARGKNDA